MTSTPAAPAATPGTFDADTPRTTDEALATIYEPQAEIFTKIELARQRLQLRYAQENAEYRAEQEQIITDCRAALAALDEAAEPFQEIYQANRWTRFFLVPGGHLHSSTHCGSLRWNTPIGWLPQYSGKSEAEIVALAGEAACTICYKTAPVLRPSQLPVHIEERKERDAEAARKAEAKAAKNAKNIHPDGSRWDYDGERYTSIRSVELGLHRAYDKLERFASFDWYSDEENATRLERIHLTIAALSEKLEERTGKPAQEYRTDVEAKARKRQGKRG